MPQTAQISQRSDASIPTAKIIDLLNGAHPLSLNEVAKIAGCSKQAIHQRVKPYKHALTNIEVIKSQRANLLALITNNMLEVYLSLTYAEQKKLVMKRGMVDFGILYDKLRLETGQSTSNVFYADMIKARNELRKEVEAMPEGVK